MSTDKAPYMTDRHDRELMGYPDDHDGISMVTEPSSEQRIKSYFDLRVWSGGMELVSDIYRISATFPSDERFGLTSQIKRAAVSVPSNIAEGWGRNKKGYLRLGLSYALGSACEVETQLLIALQQQFTERATVSPVLERLKVLSTGLLRFMATLEHRK